MRQIESGDPTAAAELLPLVYDELRKLAGVWLSRESPGQTLQPTALVHEAYLRLAGDDANPQRWSNRAHFFSAAAQAMRRILVEKARRKNRVKHGGRMQRRFSLSVEVDGAPEKVDLLRLHEGLTKLEADYPIKAKVVQLRFFAGLTYDEIAKLLDLAPITVKRHWRFAKVWLHRQMHDDETSIE